MPAAQRLRGGGLFGSKAVAEKQKEKRTCEACSYEWTPDEQKPHTLTHCPKCLQKYGAPLRDPPQLKPAEPPVAEPPPPVTVKAAAKLEGDSDDGGSPASGAAAQVEMVDSKPAAGPELTVSTAKV
jgi:hypothetical protein